MPVTLYMQGSIDTIRDALGTFSWRNREFVLHLTCVSGDTTILERGEQVKTLVIS